MAVREDEIKYTRNLPVLYNWQEMVLTSSTRLSSSKSYEQNIMREYIIVKLIMQPLYMLCGFQNLALSIENRVSAFMCLLLAWTVV